MSSLLSLADSTARANASFAVVASMDLLRGKVVRLRRGDFGDVTSYGEPEDVLDALRIPPGSRLHVVDLEGSRSGRPIEVETVRRLRGRGYRLQVGGGIRTSADARAWIDAGAEKVVIGTLAAESPEELARIAASIGGKRIIAAVDLAEGQIRVAGWTGGSSRKLDDVLADLPPLGLAELLVTDIVRDGMLSGPSLDLYRRLSVMTPLSLLASGGVTTLGDVVSLARIPNVHGAVIGRSLLDGRITFREATARATLRDALPERVIPCLDVRDGRVVKGVGFESIRDAGDVVECARRYEDEGADELVVLDISATDRGRDTALETIRRVAGSIFIPLTVGGGVRSVDDFRCLLRAGADRVAINTAALREPQLVAECAREFGVQAVVLSCDAKRMKAATASESGYVAMVRSGKESSGVDVVSWCRQAEALGAGEILLTSVDRDGSGEGFDVPLLRAVTGAVAIGVIASGGAGSPQHFREAIELGGARAVLAASLFHDRRLTIQEVKEALAGAYIPVRLPMETSG
jgi:imidazole glycerol-phosphate synthase subunit HisF